MKRKLEIIFQHGWGFDSSSWEGWLTHLGQSPDCDGWVRVADRGYFGEEKIIDEFTVDGALRVVIAHSLGLHLLPTRLLTNADLIVSIGSFMSFHFGDPLSQRRSKRTVRLMRERMDREPLEVLDEFYGNCYKPLATRHVLMRRPPAKIVVERLNRDLELLSSSELDPSVLAKAGQVLFMHGTEDAIVSPSQAHEMNLTVPGSHLIMFEGAGHALPLTHVAPCWLSVHNAFNSIAPIKLT